MNYPREYYLNFCHNGKEFALICTEQSLAELEYGHKHMLDFIADCKDNFEVYNREVALYTRQEAVNLFNILYDNCRISENTYGMHASMIYNNSEVISFFEDISRHCTIDKLVGDCIMNQKDTRDAILLTTARISSYMLKCALALGINTIASLSVPTLNAFELAQKNGIMIYDYCKQK